MHRYSQSHVQVQSYSLSHVQDSVLLRDLAALVTRDRITTATLLAYIAEVDTRRLYGAAGYSSMFAYCVEELRLSEDATAKRIHAARAARRFPSLLTALAEGRLHLTGIWVLAPHLTPENVEELIRDATHRPKSEIAGLVARRFSPPVPTVRLLTPVAPLHRAEIADSLTTLDAFEQHAPGHVLDTAQSQDSSTGQHAPGHVLDTVQSQDSSTGQHAPGHVARPEPSLERFLLQVMIERDTRDKLQHAVALLSHSVPTGNVAQVLDRALESLITQLERRKFGRRVSGVTGFGKRDD